MRVCILSCCMFCFSTMLSAQDITIKKLQSEISRSVKKEITDTLPWTWKKGGLVNVSLNQGSLNN